MVMKVVMKVVMNVVMIDFKLFAGFCNGQINGHLWLWSCFHE